MEESPGVMYVHKPGTTPFEIEYYCYQSRWAADLETALQLFQGEAVIKLKPTYPGERIYLGD